MKKQHDLSRLNWTLAGWTPFMWCRQRSIEAGASLDAEVPGIPATVPGSVQSALRAEGILPDWNVGLDARLYEWVENRHWIFTARLPDDWLQDGAVVRLRALGLDYSGWVLVNGKQIASFTGSFVPHVFDLTPYVRERDNTLQIVFDCPPRWLGQIGYTSQMTEWKPRFNYFWDWTCRLVQLGIWDDLLLEVTDGEEITEVRCTATADPAGAGGILQVGGTVSGGKGRQVRIALERDGSMVRAEEVPVERFVEGVTWENLPVELWWPNRQGPQGLYTLRCRLEPEGRPYAAGDGSVGAPRPVDGETSSLDEVSVHIGFKSVTWERCEGAPPEADPWICVVNGRPIFLQGVNWTPIRPNFADVTNHEYRRLLETYRDLGCNMLRIWGGAFLEKEILYDLCDKLGLLVWQEFPLSSSGLENWPPEDPSAIDEMAAIAESYVKRRRHHVSLTLWCGGNELTGLPDTSAGAGARRTHSKPVDQSHPMIARLAQVVAEHDPTRRFLPTSPSGPSFDADEENFGKGLHWDIHGPWSVKGDVDSDWTRYWRNHDALFISEIGAPGASSAELIREYKGDLPEIPGTTANPLWRRTSWWIEWPVFVEEYGREPANLEEYVTWSQERQKRALSIAARASKERFPRCGGFLIWMGHDSFPCTANTSIIDFHGNPKPAALAIGEIYNDERLGG